MRKEAGFSLVEIMIALVLFGIIAVGFVVLSTPKDVYRSNVAAWIAERKLEQFRNMLYADIKPNPASGNYHITTRGNAVVYRWTVTVVGYDLKTLSTADASSNSALTVNNLTEAGILDAATKKTTSPAYDVSDVKLVTVTVRDGTQTLATRSAYFAR